MKDDQIEKIKSAVQSADHISPEKKAELLRLISNLRPVIAKASRTHDEHVAKIARLVEASAHDAARKKPTNNLLNELEHSVEKFEASHPELVAAVTEYTAFLSALGI
jgi:Domain of unknown function (DUF4404)